MVETLTIKDFRSKMAFSFDRADAGDPVVIRRKHRLYAILPVDVPPVTESDNVPNAVTRDAILEAQKRTVYEPENLFSSAQDLFRALNAE